MESADMLRILTAAAAVDDSLINAWERAQILKCAAGMGIPHEEALRLIQEAPRKAGDHLPVPDNSAEKGWLSSELLDLICIDGPPNSKEREFLEGVLPLLGVPPDEIPAFIAGHVKPESQPAPSGTRDLRMEEHIRSIALLHLLVGGIVAVALLRAAVAPLIFPNFWPRPANFTHVLGLSAIAAPVIGVLIFLGLKLFRWSNIARILLGILALIGALTTTWELIISWPSEKGSELLDHRIRLISSTLLSAALTWALLHRRAARICAKEYWSSARFTQGEDRAIVRSPFFWMSVLVILLIYLSWPQKGYWA